MRKTLSLLLCAPLLLAAGLLVACGGDSVPILTSSSALLEFGEVTVGETAEATLRGANTGTADAEIAQLTALVTEGGDMDDLRVQLVESMSDLQPQLTDAEVNAVQDLVPEADLTVLTGEQVEQIRAALYGYQDDAEQKSRIEMVLS